MDTEALIGWLVAVSWLGLFAAIPYLDFKRAGSLAKLRDLHDAADKLSRNLDKRQPIDLGPAVDM